LVVTSIRKDVGKPSRHKSGAVTEGQGGSKDETCAAVEWYTVHDCHTRYSNSAEQEGSHATKDAGGDRDQGGGELRENPGYDKEDCDLVRGKFGLGSRGSKHTATEITSFSVCTPSKRDHTIVLSEGRHWRNRHQCSKAAVDTIGQYTTLNARFEHFAFDLEARHIASSGNVTSCFASADYVDSHDRQDKRSVDRKLESLDPDKRHSRSRFNSGRAEVTAGCGDDTPSQETDDDTSGLHNGRSEPLADENSNKYSETKT
jgi:hypothetical protein